MTSRLLTKCDGPICLKERDDAIHADTWLHVTINTLAIKDDWADVKQKRLDFCSYHCFIIWGCEQIPEQINPPNSIYQTFLQFLEKRYS